MTKAALAEQLERWAAALKTTTRVSLKPEVQAQNATTERVIAEMRQVVADLRR